MAASPKRVYWDACSWIALIQKERIRSDDGQVVEDREAMCKTVIAAAKQGKIEIATSALNLVEVCKSSDVKVEGEDIIASYFESDYILLVNVDRFVGEKARELMMAGYAGLKPPDAVHLATAIIADVQEMHTFDRRLLNLNNCISNEDGTKLRILKPAFGAPMPLLENDTGGSDELEEGA